MIEYTSFDERGLPTLAREWDGTPPHMPEFPVHDSGRRARGQLEALCDYIVKTWMLDDTSKSYCAAEWLAEQATAYDGKPTTSAAIGRILYRWHEIGYATMAVKPIRFVNLTVDGIKLGRAELYRREKRRHRRHMASVYRGEKPPVE